MAPLAPLTPLLSPSELSYIHTSLSLTPPIRPDARPPTTFRPLTAETNLLPSCNGSARLCYADGSEAIVGVKAEVERTASSVIGEGGWEGIGEEVDERGKGEKRGEEGRGEGGGYQGEGKAEWVEVTVDIPGQRDDEPVVVFLGAMLHEALVAEGGLQRALYISGRWHWKLYIDILLLSPPTTYPLPLLSLTTHLALLSTLLPAPISAQDEDPLFNDDWDAALPLYPSSTSTSNPTSTSNQNPTSTTASAKPPITLLIMAVSGNIFFDPSASELAVADSVLAVSVTRGQGRGVRVVAIRTVETMARGAGGGSGVGGAGKGGKEGGEEGVWRPPRGGMKRGLVSRVVKMVCEKGGVGGEVLDGLEGLDGG